MQFLEITVERRGEAEKVTLYLMPVDVLIKFYHFVIGGYICEKQRRLSTKAKNDNVVSFNGRH